MQALSDAEDGFEVQMRAPSATGRARMRLEVEACPAGSEFGAGACSVQQGTWTDSLAFPQGFLLRHTLTGLATGTHYRWRARVLHTTYTATTTTPPQNPSAGPWRRVSSNAFGGDVRTLPEPAGPASLAAGALLVATLVRRRTRPPAPEPEAPRC